MSFPVSSVVRWWILDKSGMLTYRQKYGKNDIKMSDNIYNRLIKPPKQSFFLFGLRGVGKSTWVRQVFPDAVRFDLLDEGLYQSYLRDARLFGRELLRVPQGHTVVVDEVQRMPELPAQQLPDMSIFWKILISHGYCRLMKAGCA